MPYPISCFERANTEAMPPEGRQIARQESEQLGAYVEKVCTYAQ